MTTSRPFPSMDALFPARQGEGRGPEGVDSAARGPEDAPLDKRHGCAEEPPRDLHQAVRGRTVLLTGAGGTVGQALAQRLIELPVRRLLLLDTSEHGLVCLKDQLERPETVPTDRSSRREASTGAGPTIDYLLADLRRASDRERVLRREPAIVIHAAAYKHVPFLESRPIAAVENNLLATVDWHCACHQSRSVEQFVFVSTDKATCPSGVMGSTKAGAERALRLFRNRSNPADTVAGAEGGMTATTVRLCNVFGSRGSVVPFFWRRLQDGRPLPVTHRDMKRQFIAPGGAGEAILQALPHEPATYVPTDSREIRIEQLALRMAEWALRGTSSETVDPETWIRYTGRRRGERLREQLLRPDERPGTVVEGGLRRAAPPDLERDDSGRRGTWQGLLQQLEQLRSACRAGNKENVRNGLRRVAEPTRGQAPAPASL